MKGIPGPGGVLGHDAQAMLGRKRSTMGIAGLGEALGSMNTLCSRGEIKGAMGMRGGSYSGGPGRNNDQAML